MSLIELILGTYEEFTLGYKYTPETSSLTQSFASHSHAASIRCLATCGPYVATGGSDDRIVVYNLKTRKELCMLTHHNGTVNSLKFNEECTHLFSVGQDGVFAITRIGNWQVEKIWDKAHKGAGIIDIAVHNTGKLALTIGLDATLRTWNLIKGRHAYAINLNSKCLDVRGLSNIMFSPDGARFALSGGRASEVWSIESGGQLGIIDHGSKKVASCIWLSSDTLLAGLDDGAISQMSIGTSGKLEVLSSHKAHDCRVKCLSTIDIDNIRYIISASSSGEIKMWADNLKKSLARVTADCRVTCLVVINISLYVQKEQVQINTTSCSYTADERLIHTTKPVKRKGIVFVEIEEESQFGKKNKKKTSIQQNARCNKMKPVIKVKVETVELKKKMKGRRSV